jgi:hypothetical protein
MDACRWEITSDTYLSDSEEDQLLSRSREVGRIARKPDYSPPSSQEESPTPWSQVPGSPFLLT